MPDVSYQPPPDFLTMAQAADRLGVSLVTLRRLVQRRGVQVFQDSRDARAKLVKAEDVDRLKQPIPLVEDAKIAATLSLEADVAA